MISGIHCTSWSRHLITLPHVDDFQVLVLCAGLTVHLALVRVRLSIVGTHRVIVGGAGLRAYAAAVLTMSTEMATNILATVWKTHTKNIIAILILIELFYAVKTSPQFWKKNGDLRLMRRAETWKREQCNFVVCTVPVDSSALLWVETGISMIFWNSFCEIALS